MQKGLGICFNILYLSFNYCTVLLQVYLRELFNLVIETEYSLLRSVLQISDEIQCNFVMSFACKREVLYITSKGRQDITAT